MAETLFKNVMIFDGNAKRPFAGEVKLQGNLIRKVARGKGKIRGQRRNRGGRRRRHPDAGACRAPLPRLLHRLDDPAGDRARSRPRSTWCSRSTMRGR